MKDTSTSIIDKQACDKTLLQIIRDITIDYYRCFHKKKQPFAIVSRKCNKISSQMSPN